MARGCHFSALQQVQGLPAGSKQGLRKVRGEFEKKKKNEKNNLNPVIFHYEASGAVPGPAVMLSRSAASLGGF